MFCRKCGNRLENDALFCSKCGEKVAEVHESQEKRFFSNKCESCGAVVKRISPDHYICEYCGSEYYTSNENEVEKCKITEKEILDLFYKAAELELKNKFWDELQCLLSAEDAASDNVVFLVKLGRAYRRNSMYDKALECYEKARRFNPEYACIYSNIGAVYILTKQYDKAEAPCQKAVALMNKNRTAYSDGDYNVAHSNLAVAVGMQGRKNEAKKFLKIAEENGYKNGEKVRNMIGIKKWAFPFG